MESDDFNPRQDRLSALIERGQVMLELGRPSDAINIWQEALREDPSNSQVLCWLSCAHLETGDIKNSLMYCGRAIAADPENEWAHRLRSNGLRRKGHNRASLAAALEAARIQPDEPCVYYELTWAYLARRRVRKATQAAERMRELAPEMALTWKTLAQVAYARKRWREVEQHCRKALELNPESYVAMNLLGLSLTRQNRAREAVDHLDRAAKLNPAGTEARANLKEAVRWHLIPGGRTTLIVVAVIAAQLPGLIQREFSKFGSLPVLIGPAILALLAIVLLLNRRNRLKGLPESVQLYSRAQVGSPAKYFATALRTIAVWRYPAVALRLAVKPERRLALISRVLVLSQLAATVSIALFLLNAPSARATFFKFLAAFSCLLLAASSIALILHFTKKQTNS